MDASDCAAGSEEPAIRSVSRQRPTATPDCLRPGPEASVGGPLAKNQSKMCDDFYYQNPTSPIKASDDTDNLKSKSLGNRD